jgi:TonB family protein
VFVIGVVPRTFPLSIDKSSLAALLDLREGPAEIELGRYIVKSLVGEGSMAQVYRAYDPLAERDVALKVLRFDLAARRGKDSRARFLREAQAAGNLSHPHIVTIYDVCADYIVMEYLEGENLEHMLSVRGALPVEEALAILHPIAHALDYAHARGTIHRDVKPGNILVQPDGRPTLTDFGVAHLQSATMTAPGEFLGSPSYMSPEQVDGLPVSARSDVFALAAVAYEMLTGVRAFGGQSIPSALHAVLHGNPMAPTERRPDLPAHFDAALGRALRKDPAERCASAGELAAALDPEGFARTATRIAKGDTASATTAPAVGSRGPFEDRRGLDREGGGEAPPAPGSASAVETRDLGLAPWAWRSRLSTESRRRRPRWGAALLAGLALSATAVVLGSRVQEPAPPTSGRGLSIVTSPAGAAVWLDDRVLGLSPVHDVVLTDGSHRLAVQRVGFAPVHVRFQRPHEALLRFVLNPRAAGTFPPPAGATIAVIRPAGLIETESPDGETAIRPPHRVSGGSPGYPAAALEGRLQGTVLVEMTVTESGAPAEIAVVQSAGDVLDQAVLDSVRSWRFVPASSDGEPVAARWRVQERFEIDK